MYDDDVSEVCRALYSIGRLFVAGARGVGVGWISLPARVCAIYVYPLVPLRRYCSASCMSLRIPYAASCYCASRMNFLIASTTVFKMLIQLYPHQRAGGVFTHGSVPKASVSFRLGVVEFVPVSAPRGWIKKSGVAGVRPDGRGARAERGRFGDGGQRGSDPHASTSAAGKRA